MEASGLAKEQSPLFLRGEAKPVWVMGRAAAMGQSECFAGQSIEVVCGHYEQGLEIFEAVGKRRAKRGYRAW